jgi:hypothetical protein
MPEIEIFAFVGSFFAQWGEKRTYKTVKYYPVL